MADRHRIEKEVRVTKKILIVDDDPNIVISLEFLMKKAGFEVAVAVDGEDALTKVAQVDPDLLLLDVIMPKKSGYEVCETLRADPSRSAMKIIMLSARGRDTEIAKGLALGADAYVTKPFSTQNLLARIHGLLDG
jgi:DNA-binding response OmpR family regulator